MSQITTALSFKQEKTKNEKQERSEAPTYLTIWPPETLLLQEKQPCGTGKKNK